MAKNNQATEGDGTEQNGTARNGATEQHGTGRTGKARNGAGRERNGTARNGTEGNDTNWTRQTFFRDYIVYESAEPIKGDSIQGNKVLLKFENLPIQINKSIDIRRIDGIDMLGRFAQWSHKMKANEVLDRVLELING